MEKINFIIDHLKMVSIFFGAILLSIFLFYGCAPQKPQLRVSQYRFNFEDDTYRIRSISSTDKSQSYNEIIGEKFVAADYDQDRIIDCILLGEASLNEVQKIYEYGLNEVSKEKKLQVRNPDIDRYLLEQNDIQLEIRSFRPTNAQPFNEFRIADNRPLVRPEIIIVVDHNADGNLDEVLKGSISLDKAQSQYAEAIAAGLQKGELIKVNGKILVKEK